MGRVCMTLIAAMAKSSRVIGVDGGLPWHLPADLQHFKRLTVGKAIIMGRKTFDSIGRALPGRRNFVVSRSKDFSAPGCDIVSCLDAAIDAASAHCLESGKTDVMIIGGATIYEQMLSRADCMQLTLVDAPITEGVKFPVWDEAIWRVADCSEHAADADNQYAYSFVEYRRK